MTSLMPAISTRVLHHGPMRHVLDTQRELADRQVELASGRHADSGIVNGRATAYALALSGGLSIGETQRSINMLHLERLSVQQSALQSVLDGAHEMTETVLGARTGDAGPELLANLGVSALGDLFNRMNVQSATIQVFGGQNTTTAPLGDPGPGGPLMSAIEGAFQTRFGFAIGDPATATLDAAALTGFLDNEFAALFDGAGWSAFSGATDEAPLLDIGSGRSARSGVTANDPALRTLAGAYAALAALAHSGLAPATIVALSDHTLGKVTEGIFELSKAQSRVGVAEGRITFVNAEIERDSLVSSRALLSLQQVDPFEVSARINVLLTSLETSYALTARLQGLSLLNYLR